MGPEQLLGVLRDNLTKVDEILAEPLPTVAMGVIGSDQKHNVLDMGAAVSAAAAAAAAAGIYLVLRRHEVGDGVALLAAATESDGRLAAAARSTLAVLESDQINAAIINMLASDGQQSAVVT